MLPALLAAALIQWAGPASARVLTVYDAADNAAPTWRPGVRTPRAAVAPDGTGLILPCPFRQGMERVYWDLDSRLDLRDFSRVELELECPHPAAVRRVGLYLRSGNGWYVWMAAVQGAGRQVLAFARRDAGTEGRPAGWHAVDGVRVSIMPADGTDTVIKLRRLTALAPDVALVRGTVSTPNQSERNAANSAARRVGRWLDRLDIPHALLDDEDVTAGRLTGMRVALLPYNPHPPPEQIRALTDFKRRGGRLIVCYSAEPALAALMEVELGEYRRAEKTGQWNAFAFNRHAPPHMPDIVTQQSMNIRPVYPRGRGAQVIAWWQDADGRATRDPAWVQSPGGYWMSHILLDGDDENKAQMLLALIGRHVPEVWQHAAARAAARAGRIAGYAGFDQAVEGITRLAASNRRGRAADGYLRAARRQAQSLQRAQADGQYARAVEISRLLRNELVKAMAAAIPDRPGEFRGVWNHSGTGLYPGDWPRTARQLKADGIHAVFPNLLWAGAAHYDSRIVPASDTHARHGDQLRQSAQAARRAGLELHLWKVCWNLGPAPEDYVAALRRAGRLQRTDDGRELPWLCPSDPRNLTQELRAIEEAARSGLIDGIHLDYVRYPGRHACFCSGCRGRFETWHGRPVPNWPADARHGNLAGTYQDWRCRQITALVRQTRRMLREINPDIKLSAAVYQRYPDCRASVAQDWGAWLAEGLLDFVTPMNYTENIFEFDDIVAAQSRLPGAAGRLYPGLGVTASESRLTPDLVLEQIRRLRAHDCRGFLLFDLNATLAEETLPVLRLGPTSGR